MTIKLQLRDAVVMLGVGGAFLAGARLDHDRIGSKRSDA
jgi:hypothetical protein